MKNPATLPSGNVIAAHRRLVVLIALPILILIVAASLWAVGGNYFKGLYSSVAACCSGQGAAAAGIFASMTDVPGGEPVTIRAIGLMAGTSIEVRGTDTQSIPSRFTARYGEVDTSSGIYTVPEFMPPSGLDYVTVRVDGKEQRFAVRVLPNPDIPGSDEPRLIRVPDGFFSVEPMPTPFDIGTVLSSEQALPVVLLEDSQEYKSPLPITSSAPLEPIGSGGWLGFPSLVLGPPADGGSDGDLTLRPTNPDVPEAVLLFLEAIKYWDMVTPPPTGCQEGAYTFGAFENVGGLVRENFVQNSGNFFVNAEIGAQIAASGFNVGVGVGYPYVIQTWEVLQDVERDVYKCQNGEWTFIGREQCQRVGTISSFNPSWMCVIMMAPCDGSPQFLPHMFNCSTPQ